jgi:Outer membrane protein beta-barrel domain
MYSFRECTEAFIKTNFSSRNPFDLYCIITINTNLKNILSFLILFLSFLGNAQIAEESRWEFGLKFSPDLTTSRKAYQIHNVPADPCHNKFIFYQRTFSFTGGLIAQYDITEKLTLGMGIDFVRRNVSALCTTESTIGPHGIIDVVHGSMWGVSRYYTSIHFEVPIYFRYNFFDTKLDLHADLGVATSFDISDNTPYDYSRWVLRGIAGLGINYDLTKDINLSYTTIYKRKLTDFTNQTIYWNVNSLSFEFKVLYNLSSL